MIFTLNSHKIQTIVISLAVLAGRMSNKEETDHEFENRMQIRWNAR